MVSESVNGLECWERVTYRYATHLKIRQTAIPRIAVVNYIIGIGLKGVKCMYIKDISSLSLEGLYNMFFTFCYQ